MRILIYNWVPFDERLRGGGVTVYTRNLIRGLTKKYPKVEIFFLCAGSYYDTSNTSIRYEEIKLNCEITCKAFTIVNSPVFAPAYLAIYHVKNTLYDKSLKEVFCNFLNQEGPFDVVHFQNLEGLSIDAISCKKEFPWIKFIYTIHNYYAFCPRVDLWRGNRENCLCDNTGKNCIECMICHVPSEKLKKKMELTYGLRKEYTEEKKQKSMYIGEKLDKYYEKEEKKNLSKEKLDELSQLLEKYREKFVNAVNGNMDCVLAVSKRVEEIALRNGIEKTIINTSYIGTEVADIAINKYRGSGNYPLTIIYMGYQNTEKGFSFLMDAFDIMKEELCRKINLIIAARGNIYTESKVEEHKKKFYNVIYKNGYLREEIPDLLSKADIGIVPVLWEDNLPQIAIEMSAYGVPVLCSDRGGAKELTENPNFVFEAGNVYSFITKLGFLIDHPDLLNGYYKGYPKLTTMNEHIKELMRYYI